jgi:hypothetical protein
LVTLRHYPNAASIPAAGMVLTLAIHMRNKIGVLQQFLYIHTRMYVL